MTKIVGNLFDFSDRLQIESLDQRMTRFKVLTSNIANAETPGFRAIGYDFEKQLQGLAGSNKAIEMRVSDGKHLKNEFTRADGNTYPDVYVRPTESIPEDGNTVDVDFEMAKLAENQILFRSAVELLNRKIGTLRYAIREGR